MTLADAIRAEINRDTHRSAAQIARDLQAAGVQASPRYVLAVARRARIVLGPTDPRDRRAWRINRTNLHWLRNEAQAANVSVSDMLNAILTDARCE